MITNIGRISRRHKWLVGQIRQGIVQTLQGAGNDAVSFMQADPGFKPYGTGPGTALGSVTKTLVRLKSGAKLILRNTARHAAWLEHGTPPHFIRPRRGEYLRFFWPKVGHVVFARLVLHPGTPAYRFMSRGITKAGDKLAGDLHSRLRHLFKRF